MFFSVVILLLVTLLVVTLIQNVSVRLTYIDEVIIDVDLLFFRLIVYPARRRKRRKIRDFGKNLMKNIKRAAALKRALDYFLSKSRLTLHRLSPKIEAETPARYALQQQNVSSIINVTLTYLSIKLGTLTLDDGIFLSDTEGDELVRFDATLDTSFSVILISFFKYLSGLLGVMRVVRNENE